MSTVHATIAWTCLEPTCGATGEGDKSAGAHVATTDHATMTAVGK